jgi:hypothetical protein
MKDDPRHTKSPFQVNDRVIVFDGDAWLDNGGDKGDNSCFYKPATIVKIKKALECPYEWLADVIFDENKNRISHGHFQNGIKLINPAYGNTVSYFRSNAGVEMKALIICDGSGNEVHTYFGELGEKKTRKFLKDKCGYVKKSLNN